MIWFFAVQFKNSFDLIIDILLKFIENEDSFLNIDWTQRW